VSACNFAKKRAKRISIQLKPSLEFPLSNL
jgi:hypothetical protein